MPSGPESESRFHRKLSTLSGEKYTESRNWIRWVRLGQVGTDSDGFGTLDLEANTDFRHSAFPRAVSPVQPFEVRETSKSVVLFQH